MRFNRVSAIILMLGSQCWAAAEGVSQAKQAVVLSNVGEDILVQDGEIRITENDVDLMTEDMDRLQLRNIMSRKLGVEQLLIDKMLMMKMSKEAEKLGLHKNPLVIWQMENAKHNVLSEYLEQYWEKTVDVPEDVIESLAKEYYDSHPEEFLQKEQIKVRHLLVKTEEKGKNKAKLRLVEKIKGEIQQGLISFEVAATKYSEDSASAKKGGLIKDYFGRGTMVSEFEEAAFALKEKGEVSGVVKTEYGYHLVQFIGRKEEKLIEYKGRVKKRLIAAQKKLYIAGVVKERIEKFKPNKSMYINNELMGRLNEKYRKSVLLE